MKVTVARIGRAHGLKGEVTVELRTDIPEERLKPGATLETEPDVAGPLTIVATRTQSDRWYLRIEDIDSREAAESLRGVELVVESDEDEEEGAWYVHELVALRAERPDGTLVGQVVDLMDMPAQDLLIVREPSGHRAMIPFVEEFVPEVDVEGGRVIVTPPYGLLAGEAQVETGETH